MKLSLAQAKYAGPTGRKFMMSCALAALIGGLSIAPALADRDDDHGRSGRHGNHHQREWRGDRHADYGYRAEYRRPYYYAQPVYVPPPAYYEPRRSPGISLFFPLDLRR